MNKIFTVLLFLLNFFAFVNGNKKALIIGISGQDGIYLAELLNKHDYEIHGISRNAADDYNKICSQLKNIKFNNRLILYSIDLANFDQGDLLKELIRNLKPDEIYYLAAQSSVAISFEKPEETWKTNIFGPLAVLEVIRDLKKEKIVKCFFASSCEIIKRDSTKLAEDENFNLEASNPYGSSKLALYSLCKVYKESYNLFICNGILFNHESPIRPENFLMRKITKAVAEIYLSKRDVILVGNLNSQRDYGYAKDYVKAIWLTLQQENSSDYVIANGNLHSVRDVIECAFNCVNKEIIWYGTGLEEKGYDAETGKILVQVDPKFYRPIDSIAICGNSAKAKRDLNWNPKISFHELIKLMVESDLELLNKT